MALDWSRAAGTLEVGSALERPELLAEPVRDAVAALPAAEAELVGVAEIDPELADTAAFCAEYASPLELSANCVVVAGKRAGELRYAACLVLATTRADVNGVVKRRLDVRKASFAPMDEAVRLTGMEYGGITPFGLPADWPLLVDAAVASAPAAVVGSGLRRSKIIAPGALLARLPAAEVLDDLARPVG
ncbi:MULTISPECIES: YbaK/EbsC family protein [unclassified Saccharopolyspora]|uniref:YbaK/EbsC family protein n=1 Tax=unclassified Saccharopolyspora TaxID=2646250 RepID=UPI001CD1F181|nr:MULTISPECIES: YbaK/EbsC family protein [unclassified Saccharopolyspora]MCA1186527.1 YbaK/EbsC family protein [Saccharopolyspora sp. 6T]MCA1195632.1 YbaK/EbsC family protein [Saccharopolyspora sp. 6V]MCA1227100.1 YbaK/EbsC family protein [Saccharopolyspora sp. 6M]MCA1283304.1 YbaK/EbsC family protein [Saccharopolyspora sp. 7B]